MLLGFDLQRQAKDKRFHFNYFSLFVWNLLPYLPFEGGTCCKHELHRQTQKYVKGTYSQSPVTISASITPTLY